MTYTPKGRNTGQVAPGEQVAYKDQNLADLNSASSARVNLGLGTAAVAATTDFDPAGAADAARIAAEAYADAVAAGHTPRAACRLATAAALPACTYANGTLGVGATLTGNSNGALTVDTVTVANADRILVKDQVAGAQNGIYTQTQLGDGSHPFILTRAADADESSEVVAGLFTFISDGTAPRKAGGFVLLTQGAITIGTTAQVFDQSAAATVYTFSTGLSESGGTVTINTAVTVDKTTAQTLTNKTLTSPAIATPTGIVKGDVGLGNVDNTSNATERAATATLTNKTLTSPVVNSPTGIVKGDVGLGNVDNTSNATERAASATLTNKTLTAPVLTSPVLNTGVSGTAVDTDATMAANSDTLIPSQKAVKTLDALKAAKTDNLSVFAATTSAQLKALLSDETGSGAAVFATSPALVTPTGIVKGDVGLGNVDNTSDANKPVSTAQAAADALALLKSVATTKGDSFVATAAGTVVRDGAGADGTVEIADSTQTTGRKWGSAPFQRFGGFRPITHSYGSYNGTASLVGNFNNFIRRVAAALNVPVTEVEQWYHAGMMAGLPNIGDSSTANTGIGGVFRHSYPDHFYQQSGSLAPSANSKANPFLDLIMLGVNDVFGGIFDSNWLVAATAGLRSLVTRLRAGRLYQIDDAAITFSGTWGSVLTDKNTVTAAKYKSSATLGDTMTFTIPITYKGEPIAISLLGNPNFKTTLHTALTDTTGTTVILEENANAPQSGSYVILIGTEQILIPTATSGSGNKTFTGCTRGYNGTTAATHLVNVAISRPTNITYLDFSTSTANLAGGGAGVAPVSVRGFDAFGRLAISGQGTCGNATGAIPGNDIQMVARFTGLTSADAGLTIVAKFKWNGAAHADGDVLTNQFFRPFDVIIEDADPPIQLLVNQPAAVAAGKSALTTLNAAIATIAGEFSTGYLVDAAATFDALFGATIQTATGTGESSITITPNNATLNVISKGSVLRCASESFLVTSAVTKTDSTHWTMNVTTNYTGLDAPSGTVASTGNVNHAVAADIIDARAWALTDGLHPSDYGHVVLADCVLTTLGTVTPSTRTAVVSGGYGANTDQQWPAPASGVAYAIVRPSIGAARGTQALTQSLEYADPFWIPRSGIITYIAGWSTAGSASSTLRFGLYTDNGYPYALIADLGTVVSTGTGLLSIACLIPIKRGWYWRSIVAQGGTPTVTAMPANTPPATPLGEVPSNLNGSGPTGLTRASITGALTSWDPSTAMAAPLAASAKFPLIAVGYEQFIIG